MSEIDEMRAIFVKPKERKWYQPTLCIHGNYFPHSLEGVHAFSALEAADIVAKKMRETGIIDDEQPITPVVVHDRCFLCIGKPDAKGVYKSIVSIGLALSTEEACRRIVEMVPALG